MKVAFYKAKYGDWIDKIVSWYTKSPYSHCELVFSNGDFLSSSKRDGGVRYTNIDNLERWDIYELQDSKYSEDLIRLIVRQYLGQKYDIIGAIGSAFNIDLSDKNKKFCSNLCAILLGIEETNITPHELYEIILKNNIH